MAQGDWSTIVSRVAAKYPGAEALVNHTLGHANGAQLRSREEKLRIKRLAEKLHYRTWYREILWEEQKVKAKAALGEMAFHGSMPADLAMRFCAAFYVEYVCLGIAFPKQCVDDAVVHNVTAYPKHALGEA